MYMVHIWSNKVKLLYFYTFEMDFCAKLWLFIEIRKNEQHFIFFQERVECQDRVERRSIRDRVAIERQQAVRDLMIKGDLSAWLDQRLEEVEKVATVILTLFHINYNCVFSPIILTKVVGSIPVSVISGQIKTL